MENLSILYLYITNDLNSHPVSVMNVLTKELSAYHQVRFYGNEQANINLIEESHSYDLVFIQNSQCLIRYKTLLKALKNIPFIFVSDSCDLNGYMAPVENLFEVFNFGGANLEHWGIPCEMQTFFQLPVLGKKNYYREKADSEAWQIVYYPTLHTVHNFDFEVLSVLTQFSNIVLTVVNDDYSVLQSSLCPNVKIVSRKNALSALKKAHIVLASKQEAIQAMAYRKPCIILGDYGLGGMVTAENYENLKKYAFKGRAGASFQEFIPSELLTVEINRALSSHCRKDCERIQEKIIEDYNYPNFSKKIKERLDTLISLAQKLKRKKTILSLKPLRTGLFETEERGETTYLKRGNVYYSEVDKDFLKLLNQCNGKKTIKEILPTAEYEKEDIQVFCENVLALWKEKLVVFYE